MFHALARLTRFRFRSCGLLLGLATSVRLVSMTLLRPTARVRFVGMAGLQPRSLLLCLATSVRFVGMMFLQPRGLLLCLATSVRFVGMASLQPRGRLLSPATSVRFVGM